MIEIDLEITIDRDKVFHKIGAEMIIEGMGILKTFVEMMAEIEVEVLTEVIVVTGAYQEKEVYPPEGTIIPTVGKLAVPGLGQDLEVDLIQG